jgi:hypothetical protein
MTEDGLCKGRVGCHGLCLQGLRKPMRQLQKVFLGDATLQVTRVPGVRVLIGIL